MRRIIVRRAAQCLSWLGVAVSFACAEVAIEDGPASEVAPPRAEITDLGVDDARLAAVGMIGVEWPTPSGLSSSCTGVLIGPRTVLTESWCADRQIYRLRQETERVYFVFGKELTASSRKVEVVDGESLPPPFTWFDPVRTKLSKSYGVLYLGESVTDVVPARLLPRADIQVGTPYAWVSYTFSARDHSSTRHLGESLVRAISGPLYPQLYGTFEAYYEKTSHRKEPPSDCEAAKPSSVRDCDDLRRMRVQYAGFLLDDGEAALVSGTSPDQNRCSESGAPFVRVTADGLDVYGVSARTFGGEGDVLDDGCEDGALVQTFGPVIMEKLQQTIAWKDPCEGVTLKGRCDGTVARRCTGRLEPHHRLVALDCASLGLSCATDETGSVGCFPPRQ